MRAAEFERAIAGDAALPGRRFAVYRNNISTALINALAVRYPVTERLVGRAFFAAMTSEFARSHRPQSPVFALYGAELPDFIESFTPAAGVPYLADVARLESVWWQAYHAEDRMPLPPDAFASIAPDRLNAVRFAFLPSCAIVRSRWPIVAIWEAHRGDGDLGQIDLRRGECALVARPAIDVTIRSIAPPQATFIEHLMEGGMLGEAADGAILDDASFDLAAALGILIAGQAVSRILEDRTT
jgi:hypothetical protein